MPSIAQVEPMTTARALRGPFDYRLPEELRGGAVDVGSMLVVPFGRREVLGVVVGLTDTSEVAAEKLLAPLRALELGVPAEMVELAAWIAKEYCSTISRALGLVLPPGATRRLSGRRRRPVTRAARVTIGARAPEWLMFGGPKHCPKRGRDAANLRDGHQRVHVQCAAEPHDARLARSDFAKVRHYGAELATTPRRELMGIEAEREPPDSLCRPRPLLRGATL